jgi:hypothetical protein
LTKYSSACRGKSKEACESVIKEVEKKISAGSNFNKKHADICR